MINVPYLLLRKFPQLKANIIKARVKESPEFFIRRSINLAFYLSVGLTILVFFVISKAGKSLLLLLPVFLVLLSLSLLFWLNSPKGIIRKREREINKEVLFAGRYLLVKLESGAPLFNALIDASKSYGISAKYFKEITDDINLGTPIEIALVNAREYASSEKFKLILSELVTSLKTGADVVPSLKEVLAQITKEQLIEIKTYGKRLNAVMMMYLIFATVIPSLGMTMFTVIAGFISIQVTPVLIILAISFLVIIQLSFIMIFKSIRPMVNL
ncbi:MAG: type II secretion system F family protein [DPANN group archaeon]|nr:type II secretion system F family protein [DPANN group archaeon]